MIGAASPDIFMKRYQDTSIKEEDKILMGMTAIFNNKHENLKFLLSNGLNPNRRLNPNSKSILLSNDMNELLLIFAVMRGDFESFKILLKAGADLNVRNSKGDSIFLASLKAGRQEIIDYLLKNGVKIDDGELDALLETACMNGYMSYAKYFIGLGANPKREECLINAAKGPHIEIARMLMKSGCKPTYSVLEAACKADSVPMIDILFENGLKVEKYMESEDTFEVIDALIRHGVKIYPPESYFLDCQLESNQIIRKAITFLSGGTDPSVIATLLLGHSSYFLDLVISILLDFGLDVNFEYNKRCLLSFASYKGSLNAVKLLIERGADIEKLSPFEDKRNERSYMGTPLLFACLATNNREIVSYLLENGADPEPASAPSEIMYYAAINGYVDLLFLRYTGKAIWNPKLLARSVLYLYVRRDIDSAINAVELFVKTKYNKEDRITLCQIATIHSDELCFEFVRRAIAKGLKFDMFDVSSCKSPDIVALCIEAGANRFLRPSPEVIRITSAMCADLHSVSNTEGVMFFIRRLPAEDVDERRTYPAGKRPSALYRKINHLDFGLLYSIKYH